MSKELFYVIWTTYETAKPENKNGNWADLIAAYHQIHERGGNIYMPVPVAFKNDAKQRKPGTAFCG
jgi:hypothetical protein